MVEAGSDDVALLRAGDGVAFDAKGFRQAIGFAGLRFVERRGDGAGEAADHLEVAVDVLVGDEAIQVLARGFRFGVDGVGALGAEFGG